MLWTFGSERQARVLALAAALGPVANVLLRGPVERPDDGGHDDKGPALGAGDAEDLARALAAEAVVDLLVEEGSGGVFERGKEMMIRKKEEVEAGRPSFGFLFCSLSCALRSFRSIAQLEGAFIRSNSNVAACSASTRSPWLQRSENRAPGRRARRR